MDNQLKVIGKIDLDAINNNGRPRLYQQNNDGRFRLLSMSVSFGQCDAVSFDFGIKVDELVFNYRYFSLFIGNNGVGKSSLLHEIVEFFIDAYNSIGTRDKNYVNILSLAYEQDDVVYRILRNASAFEYYKDDEKVGSNEIPFPIIIATTSGLFDKFPVKKKPQKDKEKKDKEDRYNKAFYKYVGPKVNNNMFMSKTNLMLQHLSAMNTIKHKKQLTKIATLLGFIGYEPKLTFKYKVKDLSESNNELKLNDVSIRCSEFAKNIPPLKTQEEKILFKSSTLQEVRSMHLAEIFELRQKGLLSSFKCCFYRNNQTIDCNNLSSGEFNMLSIVMSVVLSAEDGNTLILLDEPEISQHPNWQRDMIENLDMALDGYNCHFLIATHSHLLVSNLPMNRSSVIHLEKQGEEVSLKPIEANTFGWSPEEVLLKVFEMTTDRNRYLAEMVGTFIKKIADNDISLETAKDEVAFFDKVSVGLSAVDPMKKIISTITEEFDKNG